MARQTQDREWFLELDGDPQFVAVDDEILGQYLNECMIILSRLGGGIVIGANRQEMAPGIWETTGFTFKWTSFMPGIRYQEPVEVPEVEPEPAAA